MTDKDRLDVIDWLNDILVDPEDFTQMYSASELELLANNAINMLKEHTELKERHEILVDAADKMYLMLKERREVVMCKDCKWYKDNCCTNWEYPQGREPDWFCADGEEE